MGVSSATWPEKRAEKAEGEVAPLQEQLQSTKAEWEKKYQDLEEKHKQEEEDEQRY